MIRLNQAASNSQVLLQVAGKTLELAPLLFRSQILFHAFLKPFQFRRGGAVLSPRIIIGRNRHRTQGDDLVARDNADVLAAFGLFQNGGKIRTGLCNSQRLHKDYLKPIKRLVKFAAGLFAH